MALRQIYDLVMTTFQGKRYSHISGDGLANKATASITVSLGCLRALSISSTVAWATVVRSNTVTASMLQGGDCQGMHPPSKEISSMLACMSCCVPAVKWSGAALSLP